MRPYDIAIRILLALKRKELVDIQKDEFVGVAIEVSEVIDAGQELDPEIMARDVIECLMICDGVDELYGPDEEIIPAILGVLIRSGIQVVH